MNFNELMNDDTCQILLAIIVGIVICYFIFGQNSCGNGFSVGAQICTGTPPDDGVPCANYTRAGEARCRTAAGCRWERDTATPPPAQDSECITPGPGGSPGYIFDLTSKCNLGQDEVGAAALNHYDQTGSLSTYFPYTPECCNLVKNIPTGCNAAGTELDTTIDPNDQKTLRADLATMDTMCNRQVAATVDPAAAAGQSLSVEDIREMNIIDSIKNMIRKVAVGSFHSNIPARLDTIQDTSVASYNRLFKIGKEVSLRFIILVNTDNVASLDQSNFTALSRNVYIPPVDDAITNVSRRIKLGNMFDPYARLSRDDKKEIYCSKNTLTTESGEKYDQLLKMRSSDEGGDQGRSGLSNNLSCEGQDGWESSANKMYDIQPDPGTGVGIMTDYGDMINSLELRHGEIASGDSRANMITAIDGVLDDTSIGAFQRYNKHQMVIIDKFDDSNFPTDGIMQPKYIEIVIKHSIYSIRGDISRTFDGAPNNVIERGNYKLLFMDGMSSNGTPYNENIDEFDKSNLYKAYYKNLFFVQYLIFKIFLGTGKYFPKPTSFLITDPGKRNYAINAREYDDPHPDWYDNTTADGALNDMCTSSGRDYLVLGLLIDPRIMDQDKHSTGQRPTTMPRTEYSIDKNGSVFTEGASRYSTLDFTPQTPEEYFDQYPAPAPAPAPATPAVAPTVPISCDSKRFIFDTGQGCEWLDINNGEYDHKSCSEFVARSAGPGGGYLCENAAYFGADGGANVCQNGPMCTGTLPTLSGKMKDGL